MEKRTYPMVAKRNKGLKDQFNLPIRPYVYYDENLRSYVVDVKYGYKTTEKECTEGFDSACPGHKYKLVNQVMPKEGDQLYFPKTKRTFTVGKVQGFIVYTAVLYENNAPVATLKFEDYYKD